MMAFISTELSASSWHKVDAHDPKIQRQRMQGKERHRQRPRLKSWGAYMSSYRLFWILKLENIANIAGVVSNYRGSQPEVVRRAHRPLVDCSLLSDRMLTRANIPAMHFLLQDTELQMQALK